MKKRISTAAYLAGVTTLAVSLPMMATARQADLTDTVRVKEQESKVVVSEDETRL